MIRTRFQSYIVTIAVGVLILTAQAPACLADEKITILTEENVTSFIENTTDVTTNNSDDFSSEKIIAYLDKHLEKKSRFKSVMKYHIPGMPLQEATLSLNKNEFMESVAEGAQTVEGYETLVEIKSIKVSSNGKKAFVKTQSTEYASMAIPTDAGDTEDVPIEGVSDCTQIISLHKGVIQMYSANCTTNIEFLEY